MKTILRRLFWAAVITAGLPTQSLAADGQVISLGGKATVQRGAQSLALKPGDAVRAHDTVSTNEDSVIRLRMSDDSYFALPANSSFRIDEYSLPKKADSNSGHAFFSLLKGGFRTVTGLLGKLSRDSYKVNTPVATLGVRGTEYAVFYTPPQTDSAGKLVGNGSLALTVISGSVFVTTVFNGVATVTEVPEGKSLVVEVNLDASGRPTAAGPPAVSDERPKAFESGNGGANGDANGTSFDAVFNEEHAIDAPGPGEITAPGAPGTPGVPGTPGTPTPPPPPRIEPPASKS